MKKIITIICAAVFTLASCATMGSTSSAAGRGNTVAETKVSLNPFGVPDEVYEKMMQASVVDKGNNFRIKKVISKIQSGEKVYVACLGGSVTEGAGPSNYKDGYAFQFGKQLQEVYAPGKDNVVLNGAGLSGTPSPLGLVRYQSDVVDVLGTDPDLLVIEFAVNDGGEPTKCGAFEQLIRTALSAKSDAAVIALYSAATYTNTQSFMKPVASHYSIPQVSVQNAVNARQNFFQAENGQGFYTDYVHPSKEGHTIMADCLMNIFKMAEKDATDAEVAIPADYKNTPSFENFKRILGDDENVKIFAGDFNSKDNQTQPLKKTNKGDFPDNWYHKVGSGNESFKMTINCKNLIFVYKENGSWTNVKFGKAEVYVDGKLKATYDGGPSGGWNNCSVNLIINEKEASEHTVEVKMAKGDEEKGFTIVAMGYSK